MHDALILLPGLLCTEAVWQHQVTHLKSIVSALNVIELLNATTTEQLVSRVLQQAPERFALAGHSMGGWLTLEVIRQAPERVTKLCILNSTAEPDSAVKSASRQACIEQARTGEFHSIIQSFSQAFVHRESALKKVVTIMHSVSPEQFIQQETLLLHRASSVDVLAEIRCPTLIIGSSQDQVWPLALQQQLTAAIPGAKLATIDDCGHMSPMECPEAVTSLLRFWLQYF